MKLTQKQVELINELIGLKILEREVFKRSLTQIEGHKSFLPETIQKVNQQLVEQD